MWNMERAAQQEKRFLDEKIRAHKMRVKKQLHTKENNFKK